ncbi:MAG: MFS transporter, partial [Pseudomonadota bacterium]
VTLSTVARWFDKRRGLMTGVVKSGTAAGQVCIPPIAALLIAGVGWQKAAMIMGAAAAVVLVFAASLMSLPPKSVAQSGAPQVGLTLAEARRTRIFLSMCALQFLFFPTLTTVPLHIVVYGIDLGLTPAEAALLLSVTGAASVLGRLVVGGFSDRIGGRLGYVLCFAPLILALSALLLIQTSGLLFVIMAVYGFGHGGCFTVVSPTVAEFFGTRAHGAIFGPVLFFGTIGGASGPILAGWIFDVTGAYTLAFATLLGMLIAGLTLALTLPRRGRGPLGETSAAVA